MVRHVSAAQANREFSKLLRAARNGERVVVTSRGKPVAQMVPIEPVSDAKMEQRRQEFGAFLRKLASGPALNLPRFTRDDAYD